MSHTKNQKQKSITPEELKIMEEARKKQQKEMLAFYEEEIPFLKKVAEYEKLVTEIEMRKFERLNIMMKTAQIKVAGEEEKKQK